MSAREDILNRITAALADHAPAPVIPRDYHGPGHWNDGGDGVGPAERLALFADRVTDYKATVHRCAPDRIAETIATTLSGRGVSRIVTPPGLPADWFPAGIVDRPQRSIDDLDGMDGVLTACAVAIAETGTIILDHGPDQGRRALTLVPDYHLVVVRAGQIVPAVPDAIAALDPTRPMTWISGPSATSDIELSRVEGVHGPRRLDVLIVV